jgi:hypothetical protein
MLVANAMPELVGARCNASSSVQLACRLTRSRHATPAPLRHAVGFSPTFNREPSLIEETGTGCRVVRLDMYPQGRLQGRLF